MNFSIFLFVIFITLVAASDDFLEGTKRAKYFEKTDDAVPLWEITLPEEEFTQMKGLIANNNNMFGNNDFKTKNAQLVFTLGEEVKTFPEVTFSLGGVSSRYYPRQAFNVKIRNDKLYGRKQFRIRSEAREATFLRSKIFCDINNRIGQPDSVSANYIKMAINGEDMGFYVIMDAVKLTYVNIEYDDKNSTNLIQCGNLNSDLTMKSMRTCESENDDNPDMTSFQQLLTSLDGASTIEELEEVLNVEVFMKAVLMDYLSGSWDHYCLFGHNFNMYKPPNGKWQIVLYDFDATFGQDLSMGLMYGTPAGVVGNNINTWTQAKFENWHGNKHIINIILKDRPELFLSSLQEIVTKAFNPKYLFPHIDNLKKFIRPYVEEDKTNKPGRINSRSTCYDYTFSEWDANSEFTHIPTQFMTTRSQAYGLKRWILDKFNFVCTTYDIDCSVASEYLDNQFTYTTTTYTQPTNTGGQIGGGIWGGNQGGWNNWGNGGLWGGNRNQGGWNNWGNQGRNNRGGWNNWGNANVNAGNIWGNANANANANVNANVNVNAGNNWNVPARTTANVAAVASTPAPSNNNNNNVKPKPTTTSSSTTNSNENSSCWSTQLGYKCCTKTNFIVYTDKDGYWGVENKQWCGIRGGSSKSSCWSSSLSYGCCSGCKVLYTDKDGKWGIENGDWCGIPKNC
ncbi:coth protein-domain-containing protein [Neocallimastix sp. 'constans']|jgi:hypothetical protein